MQIISFHPKLPSSRQRLAGLGEAMRRHRAWIIGLQWLVVLAYAILLIGPAMLPVPDETAHVFTNLTVFAQFAFWGIWWPFVLLSMVLLGRVWCGVLCPEGALTEFASRWSLNRPIPRWLRWGGWPFVAFAGTTIYGQLISVYQYPKAVLVVLGGSTIAAVIMGLLYAREKRVWCRYMCPVNGVFGLLAKLAPLHFRADEAAWKASLGTRTPAVNCAPLLPLRTLDSASDCHSCGRCSGHRNAIQLEGRLPNSEILGQGRQDANLWQSLLLIFGMIGLAMGAFEWSASPWLIHTKQYLAEWLIERDILWPFNDSAPWWLLTHYPELNDSFSWLDGAVLLGYMLGNMLVLGGIVTGLLMLATRILGAGRTVFHHLALSLVPLAGCGLFVGLTATTVTLLKAEHVPLFWVSPTRAILLATATLWTLYLGWRICSQYSNTLTRCTLAWLCLTLACGVIDLGWITWFWLW
ncbi:4Fe-4S binding protein [Chitinimonas sp. PSY-7]|uniref:4Fe-4S binding protein n=1 Tax=Chitinimonas sp. PSY-7 TaxID=3459088 RepID=UPI0040401D97